MINERIGVIAKEISCEDLDFQVNALMQSGF